MDEPGLRRPRRRSASVGQTIGGVLVGFDEQVWSHRPPAQERVGQVDRARTVVAPGGLTIELPARELHERPTDGGSPGPDPGGEA